MSEFDDVLNDYGKKISGKGAAFSDPQQAIRFVTYELADSGEYYTRRMNRLVVTAPLPETFTFNIGNNVEQVLGWTKIKNDIAQAVGAVALKQNYNRGFAERMYWKESEPKDVTVELKFSAYRDAYDDVVLPVKNLSVMAAQVGGSLLHWNSPPKVNVYVGKYITFRDCLIKDVSAVFSNTLDKNRYPMSATVSVTFVTVDPYSFETIEGSDLRSAEIGYKLER